MRGIDLVVEGASGGVSHVIADVPGAQYIGMYFDGAPSLARNLAPGGPEANVVGSPVIRPGYITTSGNVAYIDTGVAESNEMTFIAVVRGRDVASNNSPIFIGNYGGGTRGMFGMSMFIQSWNTSVAAACETDNSGSVANSQTVMATSPAAAEWSILVARASASAIRLVDWGRNIMTETTYTYPRHSSGRSLRVGSGAAVGSFPGSADIAMAGIWYGALADAQISHICNRVRAAVAMDGIVV